MDASTRATLRIILEGYLSADLPIEAAVVALNRHLPALGVEYWTEALAKKKPSPPWPPEGPALASESAA